ncbi:protein kinase domain-containing protein [Botrimarina mediterranea]|uniref:protein kinase domain-containing protein n=1 Tax=Botrimarina mediterranea TaxID=2528022 RepID=UPI00118B0098|nr:Serine/threonine-protein kinase PknB [Planctomycetes bacterium K2D]
MAQLTTFVFTDLVGSVALKGRMPGGDAAARDAAYVERVLQPHRALIEAGLAAAEGRVVSTAGDGHFLVFPDTARATRWAIDVVRAHHETPINAGEDAPTAEVRIGMHAGAPQPDPHDPDNFVGRAVDYVSRLADHAQGGQILVSRTTAALIEDGVLDGVWLHAHGACELRGIGSAELYEVLYTGRSPTLPRRSPDEEFNDQPPREWSVLPRTMGLTEYAAQSGSASTRRRSPSDSATAVRQRRIGNYELLELIGAGGMGNVYKARHAQFDRPRAVKIIRPDLVEAGGDSVVRRFYQEVRATGALEHPNLVVAIDSSSPDDYEHYLVMEYVDGVSVDRLLDAEGPLPVADACEIARQAALGLEHLHEQGLVHRDVKPSNLMVALTSSPHLQVGESGSYRSSGAPLSSARKLAVVKLMDLGLALLVGGDEERLTRFDRGGMGTAYYMPPEQWRTTSVDIRADIYSLGCTLYCLLMGEPPFSRSDLKPERAHATAPIPPLRPACGAPRELTALVERMLAKDPKDRPQTPLEVAEALAPFAVGAHLAERVTRLKVDGAVERRLSRAETHPDRIDTQETSARLNRTLIGSAALATPGKRFGWLVATMAAAAACAAVLAVWLLPSTGNPALVAEKLESVAGLTARELSIAIDRRIQILQSAADDPRLQGWLTGQGPNAPDAPALGDRQHPLQQWIVDQRSRGDEKLGFRSSSWFVTDAKGLQVARAPYSPASMGQRYAIRDYFHGQGTNLPDDIEEDDIQPLREPHRSAVYGSTTAKGDLKVAFSVPIYGDSQEAGRQRVIGVLAISSSLGDFAEFNELEATGGHEILLADTGADDIEDDLRKGLVLHHRELSSYSRPSDPVRLSESLLTATANSRSATRGNFLGSYDDILGRPGLKYLGAVAEVAPKTLGEDPRGPWVVIVQTPAP